MNKDKCWNWKRCLDGSGYGQLGINGKLIRAHRVSYQLHVGPIPKKMCVLHKCDNPKCINPKHLFLGTHNDNMQDKVQKNRGRNNIKISNNDVIKIKKMIFKEIPNFKIAKIYNVHESTISRLKLRKIWKTIL